MLKKKGKLYMNVIVFDTETVGARSQELLNVGYKIVDLNPATGEFKELCNRDYIVRKHFKNDMLMQNDFLVSIEKYNLMKQNIACGGAILRTIEQILATMTNDIMRYNVFFGYAYNCDFDTNKFTVTAERYGIANPLNNLVAVYDIWGYAFYTICATDAYKQWCLNNDILTETQRFIKTSVEGVSAYLYDDPTFSEDHTALSDCKHELRILSECVKRGCDITKPSAKPSRIESGKVFHKTFIINEEPIEVNFTKMSNKWETSDTIKFF